MNRRQFLGIVGGGVAGSRVAVNEGSGGAPGGASPQSTYDLVVLGASPSGLAAAVQAARRGISVAVVPTHRRIGGMMAAGLTRTDMGDGSTTGGLAREFFQRVAAHYDGKPGRWQDYDMKIHFEPHVAEAIWHEMVEEAGAIRIMPQSELRGVEKEGNRLAAIDVETVGSGEAYRLRGKVFIDATYVGDLAAEAGAPYLTGREAKEEYGEPHGLEESDGLIQAYCFRLCVTDNPAKRLPIEEPPCYNREEFQLLGEYVRKKNITDFVRDCLYARGRVNDKLDGNAQWRCWVSTDWAEINADYPEGSYARRRELYEEYKRRTLSWWYFLRHDRVVPETLRQNAQKWGLAKDEFEETDHIPFMLYVREARRILGKYVFTELDARRDVTKSDTIGCGGYTIDSHHVINFHRGILDREIPPGNLRIPAEKGYQIPYRILLPRKVDGLLVSLCVSSTHLGYGTLRMEPEYIKMGQAAGAAAALSVDAAVEPADIDVNALQKVLRKAGAVLAKG